MEILFAIILGIVQGLTEFLPVSSSGHLEIAKVLLSEDNVVKSSLLMTVVLHGATAFATIYIFRKDISEIFNGLFSGVKKEVVLFAHGNKIEIWDKEAYDNLLTDEPDEFANLAEEVMGNVGNQEGDGGVS